MTKQEIYDALNPDWWILQPNTWYTDFYSTVILYNTPGLEGCSYVSSAPYQTHGLNAGLSGIDVDELVDSLRLEAAQRLFDMHCIEVTGSRPMSSVFNAQS